MNAGDLGATASGYRIFINSYPTSDGKLVIEIGNGLNGDSVYSALDTVIDYQWQKVAFTVSKTTNTLKIYLNGINIATKAGLNISDWNTNGTINIASLRPQYFYYGNIAIIKIYNKILPDTILLNEFNKNRNRFGI
jgi:GTPase SAR1 family protein